MLTCAKAMGQLARREGVRVPEEEIENAAARGDLAGFTGLKRFFESYGLHLTGERPRRGKFPGDGASTPCAALMKDGGVTIVLGPEEATENGPAVPAVDPERPGALKRRDPTEFRKAWTGKTLRFSGSAASRKLDKVQWRTLADTAFRRPGVSAALVALSLLSAACGLAPIVYLQVALDRVIGYEVGATLAMLTVAVAAALGVGFASSRARESILNGLSSDFRRSVSRELSGRVTSSAVRGEAALSSGASAFQALDAVAKFGFAQAGKNGLDMLGVGLFLPLIFAYSPVLGGVVSAFLAVACALVWATGLKARRGHESFREAARDRDAIAAASLRDRDVLTATGADAIRRVDIDRKSEDAGARDVQSKTAASRPADALKLLQALMTVTVIGVGVELVFADMITAGSLIAVNLLASRALQPVSAISGLLPERHDAAKAMSALNAVLAWPERKRGVGKRPVILGAFDLKAVQADGKHASPFDARLEPRRATALLTHDENAMKAGALLDGSQPPAAGEVVLDGEPVDEINEGHLKRNVARVAAEPRLIGETVHDNLHGLFPNLDPREIDRHVAALGLAGETLPEGYATPTDALNREGAVRVALARSALASPTVLVLDGCLDALPAARARRILRDARSGFPAQTSVLVTGNPGLAAEMDKVVELGGEGGSR